MICEFTKTNQYFCKKMVILKPPILHWHKLCIIRAQKSKPRSYLKTYCPYRCLSDHPAGIVTIGNYFVIGKSRDTNFEFEAGGSISIGEDW